MDLTNYTHTLEQIKERIYKARHKALTAVNKELVSLYWEIGKIISEKQEIEGWGKSTVQRLAKDLQVEFPGIRGFSSQNIWYMRQFYQTYSKNKKLQSLIGEIGWTHHLRILKLKTDEEKNFYMEMTRKFGWSVRMLERVSRYLPGEEEIKKRLMSNDSG